MFHLSTPSGVGPSKVISEDLSQNTVCSGDYKRSSRESHEILVIYRFLTV